MSRWRHFLAAAILAASLVGAPALASAHVCDDVSDAASEWSAIVALLAELGTDELSTQEEQKLETLAGELVDEAATLASSLESAEEEPLHAPGSELSSALADIDSAAGDPGALRAAVEAVIDAIDNAAQTCDDIAR